MPREQLSLAEVKIGVVSLIRIGFGAPGDGVPLRFPALDRNNAEALAAALQQTA